MSKLRACRHILTLPIALLVLLGTARVASATPAQVPCTSVGGGHYNCSFWVQGDGISGGAPVVEDNGTRIGYLNQGTNWIACQQIGGTQHSGAFYNNTWARTLANDGKAGWVNAVWASGGDNDGTFAGAIPHLEGLADLHVERPLGQDLGVAGRN